MKEYTRIVMRQTTKDIDFPVTLSEEGSLLLFFDLKDILIFSCAREDFMFSERIEK